MTDKEYFFNFYAETFSQAELEERWELKQQMEGKRGPGYIPDTEGYLSPTTGKWIEGRKARRDDLARSGARPWEGLAAEKQEAARQKAYIEQKQDKAIEKAAWQAYYAMSPEKRRKLRQG